MRATLLEKQSLMTLSRGEIDLRAQSARALNLGERVTRRASGKSIPGSGPGGVRSASVWLVGAPRAVLVLLVTGPEVALPTKLLDHRDVVKIADRRFVSEVV